MSRFFGRAKLLLIFVVIIAIAGSIHFTSSSRSQVTVFEQAVRDILAPIQTLFMRVSRSVNSLLTSIGRIGSLHEENAKLRAQVLDLQQRCTNLLNISGKTNGCGKRWSLKSRKPTKCRFVR